MSREDRWQNLVNESFALSEALRQQGEGPALEEALSFLTGILEVFPDSIDPVDDFEGYAVRRMALALHEVLLRRIA